MIDFNAYFTRYADRYLASDASGVAALHEARALAILEGGRVIHLADEAALHEHLAELTDAYSRAGAARADIASLRVEELGSHAMNATVDWHVVGTDGEPVRDFSTTYLMARDSDTWRIRAYTNHDA